MQGKIKWFNETKGFGFIEQEGGKDLFCHMSDIQMEGYKTLKDGQNVEYELAESEKGPAAKNLDIPVAEFVNDNVIRIG